ncbi:MAG: hypothetical protein ACLTZI_08280 [[Eubacterium] siraeum]
MNKTEILLSCMFLNDSEEMIKRSHITSDTIIVNQCDEDGYKKSISAMHLSVLFR